MMARRGFTLIELAFAAFVFSLVIGGVVSTFLGIHRIISRNILPDDELAIEMRIWREKLLFHLTTTQAGKESFGLLSTNKCFATGDQLSVSDSKAKNVYFVDLEMKTRNNVMTRRERIVVPVFGLEAGSTEVFGE